MYRSRFYNALGVAIAVGAASAAGFALADTPPELLAIRAIAEVESQTSEHGREIPRLLPADRVVAGDWVIYTLEIRNTSAAMVVSPVVTYPVPEHMSYVADSAVGPAIEVSYSVDGGRSFDAPENLKIPANEGPRLAVAADYTHIRWQLKKNLKANSVAFVRFRARVK